MGARLGRVLLPLVLGSCGDVVGNSDAPPSTQDVTLSITLAGSGVGVVAGGSTINCGTQCMQTLTPGSSVTLTATAEVTSTFLGWTGGGCSGTEPCTLTVDADTTVTAEFVKNGLTVVPSGTGTGVVFSTPAGIECGDDCNEIYPNGTQVTLSQRALAGSRFVGWTGACTGTDECIVTTTGAQEVTAEFACGGTQTFNFTGALQTFTPPTCATSITIDASGAQGGGSNNAGGLGARIVGTFTPNGALSVLVGGQGSQGGAPATNTNGGGGGGSFVYRNAADAQPLIAAGGGGGKSQVAGTCSGGVGNNVAAATPSMNSSNGAGGSAGNGGTGGANNGGAGNPGTGGGGAGWLSNGGNGLAVSVGGGGRAPRNGGAGGVPGTDGGTGGFGGGGGGAGSIGASGGGGGYTGGGGGDSFDQNSRWGCGGGGGSFNGGQNPTNQAGVRAGNGVVIITWQ